ncbi:myosin-9-like [Photinus pyralis]|uniref:myosin-9-like n=1 Tax=Photinus pyralis TaxID=7054 RepID=UPI00126774DE|nr:myosin-9-like [Photinus pyralis]
MTTDELERALQNEAKKLEATEGFLIQEKRALEDIRLKDEHTRKSLASLTAQHEELLQKHRRALDELSAEQKERVRSEQLEAELEGKRNQLEELQGRVEKMSADMDEMQISVANHREQSALVAHLKEELSKIYSEHEHSVYVVEELRTAKTTLDQALQSEMSKAQNQQAYYEGYIEKLTRNHKEERDEIENDLVSLAEDFDELMLKYDKLSEEHAALARKQKGVVGELLTATQLVIDEKVSRLEANAQINQLTQENFRLSSEKLQTDIARESMTNDLKSLQLKVNDHNKERRKLQTIITHLENLNAKLGLQLKTSEENAKLAQDKLAQAESAHKELENSLSDAQNRAYISQEIMQAEKRVFNDSQKMNAELKIEIEKLRHNITALEFQRSEGTLRLHELKVALRTEENINEEMSKLNQEIIGEMLQLDNNDLLPQVLEKFIRS